MGQTQKDKFLAALSDDPGTYLQMLANVDVKKAECFKTEDRDNIFRFVDGLEHKDQTINRVVCAQLRDSVLEILRSSMDGLDEGERTSRKYDLASVYCEQGQLDEALALYLEIMPYYKRKGGVYLGSTYGNMANVYQGQGKLDLALEYYAKALEIRVAALGEKHPSVGETYNNIGLVYQDQGKLDLALEYYAKALEIYIAALGEKHPSVGQTYGNMAIVYQDQG